MEGEGGGECGECRVRRMWGVESKAEGKGECEVWR